MALSYEGWIDSILVIFTLIFCCVFGAFVIYKSRKTNAKLLSYLGFVIILMGLTYLGTLLDFITIFFTGKNSDNLFLIILLSYIWWPPFVILSIYIGAELIMPEKKWYIVSVYFVLGMIYELFLFLDPFGSINFNYPAKSGENLIDSFFIYGSPLFILTVIFILSFLIFGGFGFLYKSFYSIGVIKKKFLLLSISIFVFVLSTVIINLFTYIIIVRIITRVISIIGLWFFYLGIREESEKKEELKPKKEVKVKESLFRITKRPDQITEEEVSISKEKKICLVCKGKIAEFTFVCPGCEAFYCDKCVRAIINLENACWACNRQIDQSKPVKLLRKEEEIDIEISDKK